MQSFRGKGRRDDEAAERRVPRASWVGLRKGGLPVFREQVEDLFRNLNTPIHDKSDQDENVAAGPSNGRFIGLALLIVGVVFIVVYLLTYTQLRSYLSLVVSACMITLGILFLWFDKKKQETIDENSFRVKKA